TARFAFLANPYFLDGFKAIAPKTKAERLFYSVAFRDGAERMRTTSGNREARAVAAKEIRRVFLQAGYHGIKTPHDGGEAVVFDLDAIKSMRGK
ncbi:unnamed protein product, partial [marine sediment metagenome]